MVLEAIVCPVCQQPETVYRRGKTADGQQRYRCTPYRRTFQLVYRHKFHEPGTRQRVTDLALNGIGVRDTVRVLGIRAQTVARDLGGN